MGASSAKVAVRAGTAAVGGVTGESVTDGSVTDGSGTDGSGTDGSVTDDVGDDDGAGMVAQGIDISIVDWPVPGRAVSGLVAASIGMVSGASSTSAV